MLRTLAPLALILLVLLGAWLIWPRAETAPRVTAPVPQSLAPDPKAAARVESPSASPERTAQTQPAAASLTRLRILCVARNDGRGLGGVNVRVQPEPKQALRTDAQGHVEVAVQPGGELFVTAEDLEHDVSAEQAEVPALAAGETRELRFVHDAGADARYCGLVVAREDGRPIAGAEIRVRDAVRATTDAAGRFEMRYAAHNAPGVRVDAGGFGPASVGAGPGHEEPANARRIELERAASLSIAMQIPEGQAALRVQLLAEGYEISQDQVFASNLGLPQKLKWSADADAQGICTFASLPPKIQIHGSVLGSTGTLFHTGAPLTLQPGEARRVEWDLRGCRLSGRTLESDGTPAQSVELWLMPDEPGFRRYVEPYMQAQRVGSARSGADGRFLFANVSPGTWLLAPAPGTSIAAAPTEVLVQAGVAETSVDLRLDRGLMIRGTIVAPDGTTGVRGNVWAHSSTNVHTRSETDAAGHFALGPLAGGRFALVGSASQEFVDSEPVECEAGAVDVVLRTRSGASVAGHVIDKLTGTGVQAAIAIGMQDDPRGGSTMTRTQPDGSFRLDGLAPGRYVISASTTAGQAGLLGEIALAAGTPVEGLQVVLEAGARVRVRFEGASGTLGNYTMRRNGAALGGDGLHAGASANEVVAAGKLVVEFRFPGVERPELRELELAPGEERELLFRFEPPR